MANEYLAGLFDPEGSAALKVMSEAWRLHCAASYYTKEDETNENKVDHIRVEDIAYSDETSGLIVNRTDTRI